MEQERAKRERSKEERRSNNGGEWTFGPKETNETLMYQKLKKKQDTAQTKHYLVEQMRS